MKTVTIINVLCSGLVFVANVLLVRYFGLEVKGELAKVVSLIGLFTSFTIAPLTINSPKNILQYGFTDLAIAGFLPTIIFFGVNIFVPEITNANISIVTLYALTTFALTILNARMILLRQIGPLSLVALPLPLSIIFFLVSGIPLTVNFLVLTLACFQFLGIVWAVAAQYPISKKGNSVFFKDYFNSFTFLPFTLFSGAPAYFSQVFLLKDITDVAILSVLFSVTQITFKFTRNIQIWMVGTGELEYKSSDRIFHLVMLCLTGICGYFLIKYFYQISHDQFASAFLILILSNIFSLNISRSDSIFIRDGRPLALSVQKATALFAFSASYILLDFDHQLLRIAISICFYRIACNVFAYQKTKSLL